MEKQITKNDASTIMAVFDTLGLDHLTGGSIDLQTLTHKSKADFVRLLPKMVVFIKEVGDCLRPKEKEDISTFIESLCVICYDEAFILENCEALWEIDKFMQVVSDIYNDVANQKQSLIVCIK